MHGKDRFRVIALSLLLGLASLLGEARAAGVAAAAASGPPGAAVTASAGHPLLELGPGDEVDMRVFGQSDMNGVMYVADDGTIHIPLAGAVHVAGLSPSQAALRVETALEKGQYLIDPHVTITLVKSRSQQVSVLGQVHAPGIYTVESNTTLLDLLAQAGGTTEDGSSTVVILRAGPDGKLQRLQVNLGGLAQRGVAPEAAEIKMRGGDQIYVPRAAVFYVTGNVHEPARYRLDADMTVLQAISRAGGITDMGSIHRIVIKRQEYGGKYRVISAKLTDKVEPNDIITVRERIF